MSGSRLNTQFGPYRLDELLGRGGMGEVYRAYDTVKDRVVAVKLLNPGLVHDATYQERFRRESHAAARLGEPHVIPIHDWGEIDGVLFIDMRLVVGEDLRALLNQEGELAPARAVAIIEQVAAALDAAHAEGLVHRDIKPENILVAQNDFAYLVDFGIAHAAEDTHLTQTGTAIGSVAYMAPELFDAVPVGPGSDIYALTCVLFECLTGQVPHPADTISAAIKAAVMSTAPAPSEVAQGVPPAMDGVIRRGLDPDPARRYATAQDMARAARAALTGTPADTVPMGEGATRTIHAPATVIGPRPADADGPRSGGPGVGTSGPGVSDEHYMPTRISNTGPESFGGPASSAAAAPHLSGPQPFGGSHASGPQAFGSQPGRGTQSYSGPVGHPGRPAPAPYPGYPPAQRRSVAIPVLFGLIAVMVVAILVVGGLWLLDRNGSDSSDEAATGQSTVTHTVPADNSAPPSAEPAVAPPGAVQCDATAWRDPVKTSCPFAMAVRDEYLRTGAKGEPRTINVFSTTTSQSYDMNCQPSDRLVVCTGGDNAIVYIL